MQLVLMAFECPHCNFRNSEVQFAGQLQPQGCRLALRLEEGDAEALNRQVVKADSATILIPELQFEVPPESQRGSLSTVEGVLRKAHADLQALQEQRRVRAGSGWRVAAASFGWGWVAATRSRHG